MYSKGNNHDNEQFIWFMEFEPNSEFKGYRLKISVPNPLNLRASSKIVAVVLFIGVFVVIFGLWCCCLGFFYDSMFICY